MAATLDTDIAKRYRITRRIGSGGAGTVYAAADLLLGRTVAIKVLHDSHAVELLSSEGRALAGLDHPNVVALHDLIVERDRACLVLEYVDGCDLESWLLGHEGLSLDAALDIFWAIAAAVAHAHTRGFLHCDLKPANILVSRTGEIKLTDFTLAHTRRDAGFLGIGGGTADYAAPEQLQGLEVDERTDVYGLGALLTRILKAVREDTLDRTVASGAAHRAMASDPADRFASVEELVDALPASAPGATRIVPRSTPADLTRVKVLPAAVRRLSRPARRWPGRWPLLVIPAALLLAVVGVWMHVTASASPQTIALPSLVATNAHTAQLIARGYALRPVVVWRYSSTVAASEVIAQRPPSGTSVVRGSTVTLIVSRGPRPIQLPDVTGMKEPAAMARLTALGFRVDEQHEDDAFGATNVVLDESPTPGASLLPRSTVTLLVSQAPWWEFWRSG